MAASTIRRIDDDEVCFEDTTGAQIRFCYDSIDIQSFLRDVANDVESKFRFGASEDLEIEYFQGHLMAIIAVGNAMPCALSTRVKINIKELVAAGAINEFLTPAE